LEKYLSLLLKQRVNEIFYTIGGRMNPLRRRKIQTARGEEKSSLVDRQEQRKRGGEPLWHRQRVSCEMLDPFWRHKTNPNIELIDINTSSCSPCSSGRCDVFKFSVGFLLLD